MTYRAPINEVLLSLNHSAGLKAAVEAGHYGDFDSDIVAAVLEEAGKFATDVLAPLNRVGDEHGIKLARSRPPLAGRTSTSAGPRAAGTRCPGRKILAARFAAADAALLP